MDNGYFQAILSFIPIISFAYFISEYLITQKIYSLPLMCCLLLANCFLHWSVEYFFLSTLLVTIFSDAKYFLISRFVTLYLVPFVWAGCYFYNIPIPFQESVLSSLTYFAFLYSIRQLSLHVFKKDGLGQGDIDLITFIASFSGFLGAWFSLMFGSLLAILFTLPQLIKKENPQIPYGSYMALATIVYILREPLIKQYAYSMLLGS